MVCRQALTSHWANSALGTRGASTALLEDALAGVLAAAAAANKSDANAKCG